MKHNALRLVASIAPFHCFHQTRYNGAGLGLVGKATLREAHAFTCLSVVSQILHTLERALLEPACGT